MSAGYDQADKRRLQIRVFNIVCRDMTFNMMHTHKWFFRRKGNGFRLSHANKQRTDQPWSVGHADCIDVIQSHLCIFQRLGYYLVDLLNVFSGCDLRHYAAKLGMQCDLGRNDIGKDLPAILHHRSCSLIAGALNRQDQNILLFFGFLIFCLHHLFLFLLKGQLSGPAIPCSLCCREDFPHLINKFFRMV